MKGIECPDVREAAKRLSALGTVDVIELMSQQLLMKLASMEPVTATKAAE